MRCFAGEIVPFPISRARKDEKKLVDCIMKLDMGLSQRTRPTARGSYSNPASGRSISSEYPSWPDTAIRFVKANSILFSETDTSSALVDQADSAAIDYAKQYQYRYAILKKAYSRFDNPNEISRFRKAHNWVDDYALFMALKDISDQAHLEHTDRVDRWTASRWISWCKKFIDEVKGYHPVYFS